MISSKHGEETLLCCIEEGFSFMLKWRIVRRGIFEAVRGYCVDDFASKV